MDSTPVFIFVRPSPDNTQTFSGLQIPNLFEISAFALAPAFVFT